MREWLPEGHLAWFVLDLVAEVDTSAFHARHPNDGVGAPAYNPEVLLALLIYAYCDKVRSSRRIEQLCETDVAYRVICANRPPDHATLARFRADHEDAITALFVDVLVLCAAAGLVSLGTIAIDGTKMGADAALDANRGAEAIRAEVQRILAEARGVDDDEDSRHGSGRGDELPAELARSGSRLARLKRAMAELEELRAAAAAEAAERQSKAQQAAVEGRQLTGAKPKDPGQALARAEADVVAARTRIEHDWVKRAEQRAAKEKQAAAEGRVVPGKLGPNTWLEFKLRRAEAALDAARRAAQDHAAKPIRVNVTDPDSRIMKTPGGFIQGYNAQAAVNEHHLVVGCGVTQDGNDAQQLLPMIATVQAILEAAGVRSEIGTVLADAGYWSEANATADGPDRLIATTKDWKQRKAARQLGTTTGPPPKGATPLQAMEHRLRTVEGAKMYAKRSCTVEPVFGVSKENRGFRRFMRRGLNAAVSEWSLINATHNILKLHKHLAVT
jgi:transposase